MEKLSEKLSKTIYDAAVAAADVAVNSACFWHYYQEEMDEQLNTLNRYMDEDE